MPANTGDTQAYERIKRLTDSLVYSGARDPQQVQELLRETYPYEHMTIKRNSLTRWLEKYETYEREPKREEAWERVSSLVYELASELQSLSRAKAEGGWAA